MTETYPEPTEQPLPKETTIYMQDGKIPTNALSPKFQELIETEPTWNDLYEKSIELCNKYGINFVVYSPTGTVLWEDTLNFFRNRLKAMDWQIVEKSIYTREIAQKRGLVDDFAVTAVSSAGSKILHLRDTLDSSRLETIVHEYCHIMQKENGMHLSRYDSELEAYTASLPFSTLDFIQEDVSAYDSFMQLVTVASKRPSTNSKRSI